MLLLCAWKCTVIVKHTFGGFYWPNTWHIAFSHFIPNRNCKIIFCVALERRNIQWCRTNGNIDSIPEFLYTTPPTLSVVYCERRKGTSITFRNIPLEIHITSSHLRISVINHRSWWFTFHRWNNDFSKWSKNIFTCIPKTVFLKRLQTLLWHVAPADLVAQALIYWR